MENSVPYHCPKCRSGGEQAIFPSLPELRQHILKVHFDQGPSSSSPSSSSSFAAPMSSLDGGLPKASLPMLPSLLHDSRAASETRSSQGPSDPEQLAQAKRFLLKEAMKSTEQSREKIRKLNEEIKIKESSLDTAIKKLGTISEKAQSLEDEFKEMETQNKEIRREMEELKAKLSEKEKLLEEKNRELAEQMNHMRSIEEKEAAAKEKLERTVEKIIERAETAERNLELMKLSNSSTTIPHQQRETKDPDSQKNAELRDVLESCNAASNAAYNQASSNNPNNLTRMATPVDSKHSATPLVQVYLKNFLEKYNELRARDYAFNQAMPTFSGIPQVQIGNLETPQNDGSSRRSSRIQAERDGMHSSRNPRATDSYSEEDASVSGDRRPSPDARNNQNNNNNYYHHRHPYSSKLSPKPQRLPSSTGHNVPTGNRTSPMWSNYVADDDDDDDPLTEVSGDLEEEEADHMSYRSKWNF